MATLGSVLQRGYKEAASNLPRITPAPLITLSWLMRLRWYAVTGQLFTVGIVRFFFNVPLPVGELVAVIGVTVISNLALWQRLRAPTPPSTILAAAVLVLDTLLLTAMLHLSGGAANPFALIYVLHVTLAVVVLGSRWGWAILALALACYGALFASGRFISGLNGVDSPAWRLHLAGMWLACLVTGSVIAYFVGRISAELNEREQELASIQAQVARNEKLASLSTLAAGAAHELGTPLATIAVVAKELERAATKLDAASTVALDARLIREECERCRTILAQMSAKAGETIGEVPAPVPIDGLIEDVRAALVADRAARLRVVRLSRRATVYAPKQALALVLTSLIRNAFDASPEDALVTLEVADKDGVTRMAVTDHGHGMSAEVLARAGDPFFSTKAPGRGTGLGLFLARAFAEGLGGRLTLNSVAGAGTTAALELPLVRDAARAA
jgi:two-component system sensor histidine kinase RegB